MFFLFTLLFPADYHGLPIFLDPRSTTHQVLNGAMVLTTRFITHLIRCGRRDLWTCDMNLLAKLNVTMARLNQYLSNVFYASSQSSAIRTMSDLMSGSWSILVSVRTAAPARRQHTKIAQIIYHRHRICHTFYFSNVKFSTDARYNASDSYVIIFLIKESLSCMRTYNIGDREVTTW